MNISEINKRHFFKTDKQYRISYGLCSRLIHFQNGIMYLEVLTGRKWYKSYRATAFELAHVWRENNSELSQAIGCKVFIIDGKKDPFKKNLYFSDKPVSYDGKLALLFRNDILN